MYTNNAYLNNSTIDRKDKSKPLVITMCGTYKLYTRPKLPTWRPRGRLDFQLLYIAAGKAHFHFDNNDEATIVHAGHMVLYRPKEPQKYEYYAKDQTEVYWVHFTGNNVTNLLRSYGLTNKKVSSTLQLPCPSFEGTEKHTIFILTLIKKKKSIRVFMILVDFLLDKI